jgi:hypothetical protein
VRMASRVATSLATNKRSCLRSQVIQLSTKKSALEKNHPICFHPGRITSVSPLDSSAPKQLFAASKCSNRTQDRMVLNHTNRRSCMGYFRCAAQVHLRDNISVRASYYHPIIPFYNQTLLNARRMSVAMKPTITQRARRVRSSAQVHIDLRQCLPLLFIHSLLFVIICFCGSS